MRQSASCLIRSASSLVVGSVSVVTTSSAGVARGSVLPAIAVGDRDLSALTDLPFDRSDGPYTKTSAVR